MLKPLSASQHAWQVLHANQTITDKKASSQGGRLLAIWKNTRSLMCASFVDFKTVRQLANAGSTSHTHRVLSHNPLGKACRIVMLKKQSRVHNNTRKNRPVYSCPQRSNESSMSTRINKRKGTTNVSMLMFKHGQATHSIIIKLILP